MFPDALLLMSAGDAPTSAAAGSTPAKVLPPELAALADAEPDAAAEVSCWHRNLAAGPVASHRYNSKKRAAAVMRCLISAVVASFTLHPAPTYCIVVER